MAFSPRALLRAAAVSSPCAGDVALDEPLLRTEEEPRPDEPSRERGLVWLRRDLRLEDNRTLLAAAAACKQIDLAFVFDERILSGLPAKDRRVEFIWLSLCELKADLEAQGCTLFMLRGRPEEEIPHLARQLNAQAVFCGRDCEPASHERDSLVARELGGSGIDLECVWDSWVLPPDCLATGKGGFYSVYGPFKRAWDRMVHERPDLSTPQLLGDALAQIAKRSPAREFSLESLGFEPTDLDLALFEPGERGARLALEEFFERAARYESGRDNLGDYAGSRLSPCLRFGTISPRQALAAARQQGSLGARKWVQELAWREFAAHLLWHRQDLAAGAPFNARARDFGHLADSAALALWQEGRTGFPLIDAGMRELRETGFMHNRARMATASFLCKDLLIDWRFGEAWFALSLMDFELASNNANWQWCSGTGADAAPFFRIFNPVSQGQKFDPDGDYVSRWVPELEKLPVSWIHCPWEAPPEELARAGVILGENYPWPMADRKMTRARALAWSKGADAQPFAAAWEADRAQEAESLARKEEERAQLKQAQAAAKATKKRPAKAAGAPSGSKSGPESGSQTTEELGLSVKAPTAKPRFSASPANASSPDDQSDLSGLAED